MSERYPGGFITKTPPTLNPALGNSTPGWVVRPVKPADEAGFVWNWSQSSEAWVKSEAPIIDPTAEPLQTITLDAATAGIVLSSFTAGETII